MGNGSERGKGCDWHGISESPEVDEACTSGPEGGGDAILGMGWGGSRGLSENYSEIRGRGSYGNRWEKPPEERFEDKQGSGEVCTGKRNCFRIAIGF